MTKEKIFTSEFTNRFGETWVFEYDYTTRKALLRGSDVDDQSYSVVDGYVPDLVLNNEEILWLRSAWAKATSN